MTEKAPPSLQTMAIFDFDGTMIAGDSIVAYLRLALRLGAVSPGEYGKVCWHTIRYALGLISDEAVKTRALRFRAQLSPEKRNALDAVFALEKLVPRVYPQARECLEKHRAAGHRLVLVSASTENYMRYVADALGFDALLCTPVAKDGRVEKNCKGEEKVRRIKAWMEAEGITADFSASFAYGDSVSDLPVLRLCGHPCLVNPRRALRRALPRALEVRWREKRRAGS